MWRTLRQDFERLMEIDKRPFPWGFLESLLFENGFQAVFLFRVGHWFKSRRIPVMGPLVARLSLFLTGVDIAPGATIGSGLFISHGTGIVIGQAARIGEGATLLHGVTIGAPTAGRRDEMPTLGDRVFIGAGATLVGGITIGSDVVVGAHALVLEDVPAHSFVRATTGIEVTPRGGGLDTEAAESGDRVASQKGAAPEGPGR